MKNIFTPVIFSAVILLIGYANNTYANDDEHHKAMNDHHGEMGHSQTGHGEENGHHGSMTKENHATMKSDHHKGMDKTGGHGMGHSDAHGMKHGNSLAGKPGKENEVSRTIKVEASDKMRFSHEPFNIKDGETIKFIVSNKGAIPHEFSIGTKDEHESHGKMMMANPNMHHGPGGASITIKPGTTESLIWSFEKAWKVEAACNIPGHYQAGMRSPVMFVK